jgi:hypothetical protein
MKFPRFATFNYPLLQLKQTHCVHEHKIENRKKVKVNFKYLVYGRLNNSYGRSSIIVIIKQYLRYRCNLHFFFNEYLDAIFVVAA